MANKKYAFVAEEIYRTRYEVEINLDEVRANNDKYKEWSDEDILQDIADDYGAFNSSNEWSLEECNIRTIHNVTDNVTIFED